MRLQVFPIAWLLSLASAWGWTWLHLSIEWRSSEQYQFGFGVPLLFAFVAAGRWSGRTEPATSGLLSGLGVGLALLLLSFGELVRRHDPMWRLAGGALTAGASLLTAVWFYRSGGGPMLRRQWFAIIFAWLALPWPVPLENVVTTSLLHGITSVVISGLNLLGIAALQRGSAIELSSGLVGLDDACSGIRSLQAVVMAGIFLGEYVRASKLRRIALFLSGVAIACFMNFCRVFTLTLLTAFHGQAAANRWHDLVGGSATAITYLALLGLSLRLTTPPASPTPARERFPSIASTPEGALALVALLTIPFATTAWLRRAESSPDGSSSSGRIEWRLSSDSLPDHWRVTPLQPSDSVREALRFSDWQGLRVDGPSGWMAHVIHLSWKRGTHMPSTAFTHTPALCMPGIGWTPVGAPQLLTISCAGSELQGVAYRFHFAGAGQIAFQCMFSDGRSTLPLLDPTQIGRRLDRISMLWQAPRSQVDEELLIYLPDLGGAQMQAATIGEILNATLRRKH